MSDNVYTSTDYTQENFNELAPYFLASDIPQVFIDRPDELIADMLSKINTEEVNNFSLSVDTAGHDPFLEQSIRAPEVALTGFVHTPRESHKFEFDPITGKIIKLNGEAIQ